MSPLTDKQPAMGFDSILILDDEMIVRKHLEEILRKRRYRVQSACNLAEAEERMAKVA